MEEKNLIEYVYCYDVLQEGGVGYPKGLRKLRHACKNVGISLSSMFVRMKKQDKRSAESHGMSFHCLCRRNKIYVCCADPAARLRVCYGLLETLADQTDRRDVARRRAFRAFMKPLFIKYNDPYQVDEIAMANRDVDALKNTMIRNIDKLDLERLEQVEAKMEELDVEDVQETFRKTTVSVKTQSKCKTHVICTIVFAILCLVVCALIVVAGVGLGGYELVKYLLTKNKNGTMTEDWVEIWNTGG